MSNHNESSGLWLRFLPFESQHEVAKWGLMALTFGCIVAAYTIAKDLKDIVFMSIVGREYIVTAKFVSMVTFVPLLILYSKLVDGLRRYRLLMTYCVIFGILGFLFSLLIGHPTIGLPNTNSGPYRLFGWIFYLFVEGYSPFVVSVFWSFANSITTPNGAKRGYGFMVAGSKFGGVLSAAMAWLFLSFTTNSTFLGDATKLQITLSLASVVLLCAPLCILYLMKTVSGRYLHGYEAAYQAEKYGKRGGGTGLFAGFMLLLRTPYLFGIFILGTCYELISQVLGYQRLGIAQDAASTNAGVALQLLEMTFWMQLAGFFISLFGTTHLMRYLGEKRCLLLIPSVTLVFFVFYYLTGSLLAFKMFYVMVRAMYYAFSIPVRESLYIPTTKDLKFKSKAWIDAFGTKLSKVNGQMFNQFTMLISASMIPLAQTIFFSGVLVVWFVTSWLLGNRYEKAIKNKEVIGLN